MYQFTTEQYNQALQNSPEEIKEMLFSDFAARVIQKTTEKHKAQNQATEVAAIVGFVLLGLIPVRHFAQALKENTGLDTETTKNIAYDVRNQIFGEVAKTLAEMQKQFPNDNQ